LSPQSAGCHSLIKQGAVLTQGMDDILFELHLPLLSEFEDIDNQQIIENSKDQTCSILTAIDYEATPFDQLLQRTNLEFQELSNRLLELELEGLIERAHNGDYFRLT